MAVKGKVEGIIRLIGSFLILICIFLNFIIDFTNLNQIYWNLGYITLVGILFVSFILKGEIAVFSKRSNLIYIIILFIVSIILITTSFSFSFLIIFSSRFSLIICWHFSLSIYKNKKIVYLISGFVYFLLEIFSLFLITKDIITIIQIYLVFIGFISIGITELIMKKKGFLNYI